MDKKIILATACLLSAGCNMADTAKTEMRNMNSFDFVKDMGAGWNLGNALDSIGPDETAWGNPAVTKAMIDAVSTRGFKTIRIPVTWRMHIGEAPDYTIEKAWIDRVEEVVNYASHNDMYVILNTHHENEWTIPAYEHVDEVTNRLNKVWTQVANRFKAYGDHLIFEPLNETRTEGSPSEWTGGTPEERDCVNRFQKASVDAIRATGGNNATRMIMIAPYGASGSEVAIKALVVPNDDKNTLISIHHYFPVDFCLGNKSKWGSADWGSSEQIDALEKSFDALNDTFIDKGKAVVIGEWGSTNNDNPQDRLKHAKYFVRLASRRGMSTVWWDNGWEPDYALLNRKTFEWVHPEIADTIVKETKKTRR